ncbi:MAG: CDP-glucose 4,6-dehydratase, partial [Vulcanimicrobiaceae bacterium]
AVVSGKPLRIRYPDATRPWQHVTDALKGYLLVAERALAGDRSVARAWNFGPLDDERIPVRAVVERLSAALGVNVPVGVDAPAHHEAAALELDSGDAQRLLHWQPRHRGRDAIDAAGAWYRAFLDGVPAGELVEAELRACVAA